MDSFYIHVGGVRVRLDLPYGARDPIGAHGMDELKAEPRDGRTKGRTYEGLLPCFRNRYRFHTALVKLKMVCSLFRTLFFIWHT